MYGFFCRSYSRRLRLKELEVEHATAQEHAARQGADVRALEKQADELRAALSAEADRGT